MKLTSSLANLAVCTAAVQAYVVTVFTEKGCTGAATQRNVFDNTCAPTGN
jgi:hypothetical protein